MIWTITSSNWSRLVCGQTTSAEIEVSISASVYKMKGQLWRAAC